MTVITAMAGIRSTAMTRPPRRPRRPPSPTARVDTRAWNDRIEIATIGCNPWRPSRCGPAFVDGVWNPVVTEQVFPFHSQYVFKIRP